MNNENWDYKIGGKMYGKFRITIILLIAAVFSVLTIDQLLPAANKHLFAAFFFGLIALQSIYFLIILLITYFCFKIYIGNQGFFFQSNPFNGKYYLYSDIIYCHEKLKVRRGHRGNFYAYFFQFRVKNGKTVNFQFEKSIYEHEINVLKERIENNSILD